MKKIISLLLALVLCMGMLAGISFAAVEKPEECAPEEASLIVTHKGDATAKYYFNLLNGALIDWACQALAGDTTITLTKNYEVDNDSNGQIRMYIPSTKGEWYGSDPDAKTLIIDLGGNTLSYTGDKNLFRIQRYGMTIKNGTIEHDGIRAIFSIGSSSDNTAITDGTKVYAPVLNLENVNIYHLGTGASSSIVVNNMYGSIINVKDSVLWTAKKPVFEMSKSDQTGRSSRTVEYTGPCAPTINIENSVVGSAANYPITVTSKLDPITDLVTVNIKDSTFVTGAKKALVFAADAVAVLNTNGVEPVLKEDWSQLAKIGTLTGKALVYGSGENTMKLPFTDVAENEWYYGYVRDLYNANIISGMTATTFAPNGTLTYGQALKLITLAVGVSEQEPTDAHWASGYMNYALSTGWLYNEANLDSKITRQQFCQIAAAAAGIVDQPAANPFKDTTDGAVLALYNAGIINGMSADTFSPDSSLTRAQISKIICGIINK